MLAPCKPAPADRHLTDVSIQVALAVPAWRAATPGREPRLHVTDLVRQAREGDDAAFEALYRANVGRVYALCLRLSADPRRAEELTQDTFVRAWERLHTFRGDAAFTTWLHRLTVNVVFMARRAERRRERRVLTIEAPPEIASAGSPAGRIDLERAIASLPDGAREVFVLHDIEGYRHREIAALTGLSAGTSKAQLFRARRLLRRRLDR